MVGPDVIFASNTSTLPITSLAETSLKPEDFVGIHFFSPVDKMALVEIIKGEKTGDRAVAAALDFVRLIKKTPIVVNDTRGFFANRCVGNYLREGHLMLAEGDSAGDDRECRAHGRDAGRPAVAQRRSGARSVVARRRGDEEGSWRAGRRSGAGKAHPHDGRREGPLRPQERQGLLRLSGEGGQEAAVAGPRRSRRHASSIPIRSTCRN